MNITPKDAASLKLKDIENIFKKEIEEVCNNIIESGESKLYSCSQDRLIKYYYFKRDDKYDVAYNVYKFNDLLDLYERQCRRWEEHCNGVCCVVERVRDKYLLPRIKEFLEELNKRQNL